MSLVAKARRPAWQDGATRAAIRDSYRIANANFRAFAQAYEAVVGGVIDDASRTAILNALAAGDAVAVTQAIPWFDPRDEASIARWQRLQRRFETSYEKIVEQAGAESIASLGFDLSFTLDNPYSAPWIQNRSGLLIQEISSGGLMAIRDAVEEGFRLGNPPREMARTIRESIGLLDRDAIAVQRRLNLHLGKGMDPDRAGASAERYAQKLLNARALRIARTETIMAEAKGLQDSWRVAADEGLIAPGTKKEWIAAHSERTCPICEELDGQQVDLDQAFDSAFVGPLQHPPGHVACRCSMGLVFA